MYQRLLFETNHVTIRSGCDASLPLGILSYSKWSLYSSQRPDPSHIRNWLCSRFHINKERAKSYKVLLF